MNSPQLVFKYLPSVRDLPLILAGPILRHTTPDSVTVWLALKAEQSLCLEIYTTQADGTRIGQTVLTGRGKTIALGKHLHIITITAKAEARLLEPGKIYAYNVYCQSGGYSLLDDTQAHRYSLSYFEHRLPTFALPPADLNHLKIIHGSCRKPHGGGQDTLAFVDNLILESPQLPTARPHQLFLTGDQIYGDDVADPILWLIQGISKLLLGWTEELPLIVGTIKPEELSPGKRTKVAEIEGGLTAMFRGASAKAKSHLMSFGEYVSAYLLAWSPVLIPAIFPSGQSLFEDRKQARGWQQEVKDIRSFVRDLHFVRRGLANIPVYTICDDHDVSDDWYLNREWCDRVLGKPLGKRIVQNGVLTYALFQAWGNTPQYFEPGTAGHKLIQLAAKWCQSEGKNKLIKAECDRYLGIPKNDPLTQMPELVSDADVAVLKRDELVAIPWHYTVSGDKHQVIVLDTRTWRGYDPQPDKGLEPPMLLSPKAFRQQLAEPLSQNHLEATILVLPTNLVALGIIDRIQKFELSRDRVFSSDVGDSWNFHDSAFAQLLLTLCNQRQRVIILSGDIHYSCAVKLSHWDLDTQESSVLVQLTSSAIKNSELATRLAHTKLKSLLPEKNKRWRVQNRPFKIKQVTAKHDRSPSDLDPDWQYHVEWCRRQPAQSLGWQMPAPKISVNATKDDRRGNFQPQDLWHKFIASLGNWFWRNRWLQEGTEVVGRNNLSLVRFEWQHHKTVIQETYWHPPWDSRDTVKSLYKVSLEADSKGDEAFNQ